MGKKIDISQGDEFNVILSEGTINISPWVICKCFINLYML